MNEDRREARRTKVIKSAKLIFGGGNSVYDCLVLDESSGGALVDMGALVTVPEQMTIQFGSGATFPAERRWAVGTKAGLRFTGGQVVTEDAAQRMHKMADIIDTQGLPQAMQLLRTARFFDHAELRRAAEEAEASYHRLTMLLTGKSESS